MNVTIPDGGQGGHLYKFVTVLGSFIVIASIYAAAVVYDSHDARVRTSIVNLLDGSDTSKDAVDFWTTYLVSKRNDTAFVIVTLFIFAVIGLSVAIAAGFAWWVNVQSYEDQKRRLDFAKLKHELDTIQGKGKQMLVGVE